jgi:LPXTG-motif cell wall-anchored protein
VIKRIVAGFLLAIAVGTPAYATEDSAPASAAASASAPAEAPNAAPECAAYSYYGTKTSLCDDFAGAKDVDCKKVGYRVQLKSNKVDPWDLDGLAGGDRGQIGLGCESYGRKQVTPSASTSPSPSESTSAAAADEPELPLTGPSGWMFTAVGGALVGFGLLGLIAVRRRRARFTA